MNRLLCTLTAIFICLVATTCFAQNSDDVYNPAKSVSMRLNIIEDKEFMIDSFVKGTIIMPFNAIRTGLIRFNGNTVIFKDTLTQKTKRYGTQEIKGFTAYVDTGKVHNFSHAVIPGSLYEIAKAKRIYSIDIPVDTFKVYTDTFVVKPPFGHAAVEERVIHSSRFLKQLIYGDKVCLYKTTIKINGGGTMNGFSITPGPAYLDNIFYFKRNNEVKYTEIPKGKRAFKKMMAAYIKDNDELIGAINSDQYGFAQLEQITMMYNQNKVLTNAR